MSTNDSPGAGGRPDVGPTSADDQDMADDQRTQLIRRPWADPAGPPESGPSAPSGRSGPSRSSAPAGPPPGWAGPPPGWAGPPPGWAGPAGPGWAPSASPAPRYGPPGPPNAPSVPGPPGGRSGRPPGAPYPAGPGTPYPAGPGAPYPVGPGAPRGQAPGQPYPSDRYPAPPDPHAGPHPYAGPAGGAAPGAFVVPPGGPTRPANGPTPSDGAPVPSRRGLLIGAGVAVVGAAAGATWYAVAGPTPRRSPAEDGYSTPSAAGTELGPLTDIPENGGIVFDEQEIVVTRGTGNTVHGFSAVCTHQGCLVSRVSQGEITCPCHGSAFDATTGGVVRGPARSPLPAVPVKVVNGSVVTG